MVDLATPRFDRLLELRNWLMALGCCPGCRIQMAWAQMWREFVEPAYRLDRPSGMGCPNRIKPDCWQLAKAHWREMPPRVA